MPFLTFCKEQNIKFKQNEPMKNHTSFKIGGCCDYFVMPENTEQLKDVLNKAKELNIPVFVTEWGINDNGTGAMHEERAMKFVQMMKKNNISWCMWSLSNKNEVYSMLKPNCNKYSNWNEKDFTFSGKIALKALSN